MEKQDALTSMSDLADAAFASAAERVLRRARQTGTEVVLWRNGRIVKVSPEEIERDLEEAGREEREPK